MLNELSIHSVTIHICSHRPISVENIYNAVQTRIVLRQEEVDQDIPDYEDVFRDDEVNFKIFYIRILISLSYYYHSTYISITILVLGDIFN